MGVVKLSTAGILDYSKTSNFLSGNAPVSFGAFDLLETTTLTSSASSVTFSGLGAYSDYKHLQIRAAVRSNRSSGVYDLASLRLNSDSGTNYIWHTLEGNGSSVSSYTYGTSSGIQLGAMPEATDDAGAFGSFVLDILDFANTSKNTTTRNLTGWISGTYPQIRLSSGLWMNTNAVTSVQINSDAGNFITGSRFSLIGVK